MTSFGPSGFSAIALILPVIDVWRKLLVRQLQSKGLMKVGQVHTCGGSLPRMNNPAIPHIELINIRHSAVTGHVRGKSWQPIQ